VTDDTDDKIRRNLVVFSSLVILVGFLGLPMDTVIHKVFDKSVMVRPERVLGAGFAVLSYLLARYRYSPEGENFVAKLGEERQVFTKRYILYYARLRAVLWRMGAPGGGPFTPSLDRLIAPGPFGDQEALGLPASVGLNIHEEDVGPGQDNIFRLTVGMSWHPPGGEPRARATSTRILIVGPGILFFRFLAALRAWTYSKAGIIHSIPLILAGLSLYVMWERMAIIYGAAWGTSVPAAVLKP
jgi:hypothetical protein